jgi:hypothetical protein
MKAIGVALATLGLACGARAGELTLYESTGFGGHQLTLRASTPDLADVGFAAASSAM